MKNTHALSIVTCRDLVVRSTDPHRGRNPRPEFRHSIKRPSRVHVFLEARDQFDELIVLIAKQGGQGKLDPP